ncbi:MAG: bifunctional histidinol-phosphatase/imidazoleglycerol-phosphate dehydratase, partial [Calditrichaeota bacterium]|nr:bifunctional histidinol-phosphatase/imidazoleglycerol-phosphate dehydratase [Calditrichota bacterium]
MNILFLDRDGTLIREPEDYQVDSLEKLEILPGLISSLLKLNSRFRFVMITNQDGLGTDSFPLPDFEIVQEKLLRLLANEAIYFDAILVCPHGPEDHC